MQKHTQPIDFLSELRTARYASLRTYRQDGTAVDTPIWFDVQTNAVVFRTKIGPKTKRLAARPDVELTACDYRGQLGNNAKTYTGRAMILSGTEAEEANRALHRLPTRRLPTQHAAISKTDWLCASPVWSRRAGLELFDAHAQAPS